MGESHGEGCVVRALSLPDAEALLFREARLLDLQDFSGWLELYAEDVLFWMPAWREDNTLTEDPDQELSLIYYRGKDNLRDRVDRLTSGLSPVSRTLPRVVHLISNVEMVDDSEDEATVRSSFVAAHHAAQIVQRSLLDVHAAVRSIHPVDGYFMYA